MKDLKLTITKYKCKKCGHIEEPSKTETITNILANVFIHFFTIFGVVSISMFFMIGPNNLLGIFTESVYEEVNEPERDELRNLTMKLTWVCSGDNSSCYSKELYYNTKHIRYVPNSFHKSIFSPLYTYENGGDCDNLANMYVEMLNSVGIEAQISCSIKFHHCIAVVPYISNGNEYNKKFIVDLANDLYTTIKKDENEWELYNYI